MKTEIREIPLKAEQIVKQALKDANLTNHAITDYYVYTITKDTKISTKIVVIHKEIGYLSTTLLFIDLVEKRLEYIEKLVNMKKDEIKHHILHSLERATLESSQNKTIIKTRTIEIVS